MTKKPAAPLKQEPPVLRRLAFAETFHRRNAALDEMQIRMMPMRQNKFAVAAFLALFPLAATAQPMVQSQEGIALENQILQLQNQVQQLQGSGGTNGSSLGGSPQSLTPPPGQPSGAAPSSDIVGSLLTQVSQLQAQVQQLSGRIDTLQNQVDTQHDATEKEIGDLSFKLSGTAAGTTATAAGAASSSPGSQFSPGDQADTVPPSAPSPPLPSPTQPAVKAPVSPKAALAAAQAALARHDYANAASSARNVLSTSKSSAEGYKAQFIFAEALYGEGKPQDAAIAFDDSYNRSRSGTYAPASLLGLANALTDIQQQSAACDTLASLNSQFPAPPPGMAPRIAAAKRRAKCG